MPLSETTWGWRVLNIARLLRSGGHDVDLVQYVYNKGSYERLKCLDDGITYICSSLALVHLAHDRVLRRNRYDLVYGNTFTGAFSALGGKIRRTPLIYDMHGGLTEEFLLKHPLRAGNLPEFTARKLVDVSTLALSDRILCVSNAMMKYFNMKGVPLSKMAYITNGVDLNHFRQSPQQDCDRLKQRLNLEGRLIFGYIGGFQKWQGVDAFMEVARSREWKDAAFLIVGEKGMSNEQNLTFVPQVSRDELPLYYSACDVLVLPRPAHPATEMAAPTKFAEYTSMGKPVLTTKIGDAASLVDHSGCGIVVNDNSIEQLTAGVSRFVSLAEDERKAMGLNARKLAEEQFDWDRIGEKLNAHLVQWF